MSGHKTTVSFQADVTESDALQEIADTYNVSKSAILRSIMRRSIEEHEDTIPDYMVLQSFINSEKEKSRPFQTVSHLPNNMHEQARNQIDKPYPMHPEVFQEEYFEPYRSMIEKKYSDNEDMKGRKLSQLSHAFDMYVALHPETETKVDMAKQAIVHHAKAIMELPDGSMDDARGFINARINDGIIPESERDGLYDKVREEKRATWQTAWKGTVDKPRN